MVKSRGVAIVLRGGEETRHLTWSAGDGDEERVSININGKHGMSSMFGRHGKKKKISLKFWHVPGMFQI